MTSSPVKPKIFVARQIFPEGLERLRAVADVDYNDQTAPLSTSDLAVRLANVDVCPVDCFREGPNFLVIDPDECIDCAVCVPECPVNAIYAEDDVPGDQQQFISLNTELARSWKSITKSKGSLPEAEDWKDVKNKLDQLVR